MPEVIIVKPTYEKEAGAALSFGFTLVNDYSVKSFAFQNIGPISAKVIIEIHEDPQFLFTLGTHDNEDDWTNKRDHKAKQNQSCFSPRENHNGNFQERQVILSCGNFFPELTERNFEKKIICTHFRIK